MKRTLTLVFFFLVLLSCGGVSNQAHLFDLKKTRIALETVEDLYAFFRYSDGRIPLVSAHRGGPMPGYPENAIETFGQIAKQMPAIIECDIAQTQDGELVLLHDDTLGRTTTGVGRVRDYTLKELKKLRLKDSEGQLTHYRIPTLGDALAWGKGKVVFTLDVKRGVPYKKVVEVVRQYQAEAFSVIITYTANQAVEIYRLAPELMISANIRKAEDLTRLNDMGVPDDRLIAFLGVREPEEAVYTYLHEHGILCILGTMGNLDRKAARRGDALYYQFLEQGVDILATDRPMEAWEQISLYRKKYRLASPYLRN